MATDVMFAGWGKVFIRQAPDAKGKKIQHLVWGDYIEVLSRAQEADGWLQVKGRGEVGWLHVDEVQGERLLEVNFVDVGQGDGAFLVTPDDEFCLVDAGEGDNMRRFLSWRFNLKLDRINDDDDNAPHEVDPRAIEFKFAVISHGDQDHYQGFARLFESERFRFDRIYHNTLVERPADSSTERLGERAGIDGRTCVVGLIETKADLEALLEQHTDKSTNYLKLLRMAAEGGRVGDIVGITRETGFLRGFGASNKAKNGKRLQIEVLGPVPLVDGNTRGMPDFGGLGKTKNGHSVVLRIRYGDVRLLLGGDLNVPAEEHLLLQSVGPEPSANASDDEWNAWLTEARKAFGVDIAKSCHHGSADLSTTFLRAIDAAATVISSGDEESYCHPRPDTLGVIGRHGRGERPMIFSTELMRSTPEFFVKSVMKQQEVKDLLAELRTAEGGRRTEIERAINAIMKQRERGVAVYGMISMRTDGQRVVMSQKLEKRAGNGNEFDLHWFAPDAGGTVMAVEPERDD